LLSPNRSLVILLAIPTALPKPLTSVSFGVKELKYGNFINFMSHGSVVAVAIKVILFFSSVM